MIFNQYTITLHINKQLIAKRGKRYEVLARVYLLGARAMVELASAVFGVVGVFEGFMVFAVRLMYDT